MKLQGLHHVTMITGDAQRNIDFYAGLLGLRFVKKTVNFDQPEAYHLYFGDELGTPGSILTWFEFPGAQRGRAGAGMIHRIELGVGSADALDFWQVRLSAGGYDSSREQDALLFEDYDGLGFALVVAGPEQGGANPPLRAVHPEVAAEHAITGIVGARAYVPEEWIAHPHPLLTETLGFTDTGDGRYELRGELRSFNWTYDVAPGAGVHGAGNVHHIAWACRDEDQPGWQAAVRAVGASVTEVLDRDYFTSIYFREPRHILFEIATMSPGFAVDEDPAHLGEELRLPRQHEHLRPQLERVLTPLRNPRSQA